MTKDRLFFLLDNEGVFYVLMVLEAQADAWGVRRN
jgi:hypothetical protein